MSWTEHALSLKQSVEYAAELARHLSDSYVAEESEEPADSPYAPVLVEMTHFSEMIQHRIEGADHAAFVHDLHDLAGRLPMIRGQWDPTRVEPGSDLMALLVKLIQLQARVQTCLAVEACDGAMQFSQIGGVTVVRDVAGPDFDVADEAATAATLLDQARETLDAICPSPDGERSLVWSS